MSTQTQNIGLIKPALGENVSLPVINTNYDTIDTEIAARAKTSDIQNNLTSTATNKPLSAAQGKALNDAKVNVSDIQNILTSTATNKPLSAAQGKSLSDMIAHFRNASGGSENAGSDANTMTNNGFYYRWYSSGDNFPVVSGGFMIVVRHNSNSGYGMQLFVEDSVDQNVWVRRNLNGTWQAWKKLVTENNTIKKIVTTNIAAGGQYTHTIVSGHCYRVSMMRSGACSVALIDQWASVCGVISSAQFQITCPGGVITCKNTSSYYCNVTIEDLG